MMPRGQPGRPAVVPQDRAALVALFREIGALHLHLSPRHGATGRADFWALVHNRTRVCGTERCAWIKLR